jgi:hypothetical protein
MNQLEGGRQAKHVAEKPVFSLKWAREHLRDSAIWAPKLFTIRCLGSGDLEADTPVQPLTEEERSIPYGKKQFERH